MDNQTLEFPLVVVHHPPWNKNRIIGQKAPFKLKEICAIRAWLDFEHNVRDRALLDIAIDSKMRGGDVTRLRVQDVCHGEQVAPRASVRQSKTQRPVTFEITPTARKSVAASNGANSESKGFCQGFAAGLTETIPGRNRSPRWPLTAGSSICDH